uniref:Uncharacterized protein n=1 Tax=candidate division WOR-3 bacterium TaxID=2052148 RepID=A0A7V3KP33_UNCW3
MGELKMEDRIKKPKHLDQAKQSQRRASKPKPPQVHQHKFTTVVKKPSILRRAESVSRIPFLKQKGGTKASPPKIDSKKLTIVKKAPKVTGKIYNEIKKVKK